MHAPPDFRCVHRSKAKLQRFFRRSALGTDADRRYIYISLGCRDRGRFTFNSAAQTADSLLILGWWTRWVSLGSAILLAMFGTAMAISLGLKSPMDYSVYSASAAAVLLALHAFNQRQNTLCIAKARTIAMRRQRNWIAIIAMFGLTLSAARSFSQKQSDAALLRARETVWRAWFAGDIKTLEKLVPPESIVMSGGEKEWKHQSDMLQSSVEFHSKGGRLIRLEFPRTEVQHFGDVAIVWSSYVVETEVAGKRSVSSSRVTEIFVWLHGRWINPGWHTDEEK